MHSSFRNISLALLDMEDRATPIHRRGVSLIEVLIVLVILGGLLALLMPAIQRARERSRETVCKNNLRQLSLAFSQLHQTWRELPVPPPAGQVGGWSFEYFCFWSSALYEQIGPDAPLTSIPPAAAARPRVMSCPGTDIGLSHVAPISAAHFVLGTSATRDSWIMFDAPLRTSAPWPAGPELLWRAAQLQPGPHQRGYHFANSDGSVRLFVP